MQLHELKIKKEYMDAIAAGRKTFELRKNDRDYKEGDVIKFNVLISDGINSYAIKNVPNTLYIITYVLKDVPQYGLDADYCILGIKRLKKEEVATSED